MYIYNMEVSYNGGTPKSSIPVGFLTINHPSMGDPPLMEASTELPADTAIIGAAGLRRRFELFGSFLKWRYPLTI